MAQRDSDIAEDSTRKRLDACICAFETEGKFMGSVAISRDGRIIYTRQTGYACIETNTMADARTGYRIGSISKLFTAILVLRLTERNVLHIERTIEEFFPEITNANRITIGQMLSHRSGIHNFVNDPGYTDWDTHPRTREQMLCVIREGGNDFEPGNRTSYSDSNQVLLTILLERLHRKSYADILVDEIVRPLGLENTYSGDQAGTGKNEACSYRYLGTWVRGKETNLSIPLGAACIVSTPSDMLRFFQGIIDGSLVTRSTFESMCIMKDGIGMGLFALPFQGQEGIGHMGGIDQFISGLVYFPGRNTAVSFSSNGAMRDISDLLYRAALGMPFEIPDFHGDTAQEESLSAYTGEYTCEGITRKLIVSTQGELLMVQITHEPYEPFTFEPAGNSLFKNAILSIRFSRENGRITAVLGPPAGDNGSEGTQKFIREKPETQRESSIGIT